VAATCAQVAGGRLPPAALAAPTANSPTASSSDAAFADPAVDWSWLGESTNDKVPSDQSDLFDLLADCALRDTY